MKKDNKVKFKILTLGCKVNQYDSAVLGNILLANNFIKAEKNLNLIIINSCSVTKTAISKSRKLLSTFKKQYPKAITILMGCWPKIYRIEDLEVDFILNERNIEKVAKEIKKIFNNNEKKPACEALNIIDNRCRYFIKIQDGCEQFCSYCVIPFARGPLKSRSSKEILKEVKAVIESGIEEIVLSGIHLGLYGKDFKTKDESLASLLQNILSLKGNFRLRLSSIEITEVSDELIDLMSKNEKMCRHLHIPLQSGNDKILKLMNRPYNTNYFNKRIKKIREKMSDMAISTDVIVGFPGEKYSDFKATYEFCKLIKFSKIHVFSFSAHEKAPAFHYPDKVSLIDIKNRSKELRALSKKQEQDFKKETLNQSKELDVIIESVESGKIRAKSQYYFDLLLSPRKIHLPKKSIGKIIKYKL